MKLPRRRFLHLVASVSALPALSATASAQSYPTRPIRLVVPFPPGGAYDTIGRPWAEQMKTRLGTLVIENIGGGGRLPRRGAGLARAARRLHAAAWRRDDAYHRGAAQEPAAVRLAQRLRADLRHPDHPLCAGRASLRAGERPQRADRLCEGQSGQAVLPLRRYPLPESPPRRSLQAT